MFDLATAAVEGALAAGATYADARAQDMADQRVSVLNGEIESISAGAQLGVGVRALIGSAWGFAATAEPTGTAARAAGTQAAAIARASAMVPGPPLRLADVAVVQTTWSTPVVEDPLAVPLDEKVDLLVATTRTMLEEDAVALARADLAVVVDDRWFVSSQGHRIHQRITKTGGGSEATAVGEHETQRRSHPQAMGHWETGGFEVVRRFDLVGNAPRIAAEAAALLTAPQCPATETDVILDSSQVALQIHESVGHAIELDRILGWEAAFAGTSFLDLDRLGSLRYGSELMNITADATLPGALGSFGYDDEGTPAQRVDIVREGTWVGVLSGRDSAAVAGLPPGGMVRASGYDRLPMVRMTNVGLLPGEGTLEDIVADTADGILMSTNRSWSIDDRRLNFQFGCEIGWEIKNGERARMLRNPSYTGITPRFWGSMDRLAGAGELVAWGTPNCGKGQPLQVGHTGHPAAPARFRGVRVGVAA